MFGHHSRLPADLVLGINCKENGKTSFPEFVRLLLECLQYMSVM